MAIEIQTLLLSVIIICVTDTTKKNNYATQTDKTYISPNSGSIVALCVNPAAGT